MLASHNGTVSIPTHITHGQPTEGEGVGHLFMGELPPDPEGVMTSISSKSMSHASISAHLFRGRATVVFSTGASLKDRESSPPSLSSPRNGSVLLGWFSLSARCRPPARGFGDPPYRFLDGTADPGAGSGAVALMLAFVERVVVLAAIDESCEGDLVSRFLRDVEGERTAEVVMVVVMRFLVLCFNLAVGLAVLFCFPPAVALPGLPFPGLCCVVLVASLPFLGFLPLLVGRKLKSSSSSWSGESESAGISNSVGFVRVRSLAVRRLLVGIMAACNSSVVIAGAGFTGAFLRVFLGLTEALASTVEGTGEELL